MPSHCWLGVLCGPKVVTVDHTPYKMTRPGCFYFMCILCYSFFL